MPDGPFELSTPLGAFALLVDDFELSRGPRLLPALELLEAFLDSPPLDGSWPRPLAPLPRWRVLPGAFEASGSGQIFAENAVRAVPTGDVGGESCTPAPSADVGVQAWMAAERRLRRAVAGERPGSAAAVVGRSTRRPLRAISSRHIQLHTQAAL
jgi:hypothetical protein